MDANGLRFWMLANREDWVLNSPAQAVAYDKAKRCLRLASRRQSALPLLPDLAANRAIALERLNRIPQTRDGYGTWAFWDDAAKSVMATGAVAGATPIFAPTGDAVPTDLATGFDGILYLALNQALTLVDLRRRWSPTPLPLPDFAAWRLAAAPEGGVWILDRDHRQLAQLIGQPLPDQAYATITTDTFRPCVENPNPPRLIVSALPLQSNESPVAIACHPQTGVVSVLCWVSNEDAVVYHGVEAQPVRFVLKGVRHPYTLTWAAPDRMAVIVPELAREALVYELSDTSEPLAALGDFYPLRGYSGDPFVHGVDLPPHYGTAAGPTPLHPLSLASFAPAGESAGQRLFDSESTQTAWHRLYVEAVIPPRTGVRVLLAASDQPTPPANITWFEHRFGVFPVEAGALRLPHGAWVSQPSEIPFHQGFLPCAPQHNQAGLFTVLIQRSGLRVSTLRGRYLHVRVLLQGDGHATPEIYALRAYGARFSYVERYLPALYHETNFGADADATLDAGQPRSPADFLERFVDNFEGILTPLEDRIAYSWLLTDANTVPAEALAWLSSWIGVAFAPAYPQARRRQLLANAPTLFRRRGTLAGLTQALEIATGGGVSGGEIVIVENWRLRRTFVTILGANLAAQDDPLLAGLSVSGNSFVGDTLFVADVNLEQRKEFLALFAADLLKSRTEAQVVAQFLDRLAYRVTVLVHQEIEAQELGLIRQIVELEKPAHIDVQVLPASEPFRVGIAALVGVDSYLGRKPQPRPVRVDRSRLGIRDLVLRPASLDPRLEGGRLAQEEQPAVKPVARIQHPDQVMHGQSFQLDASRSEAPAGRQLVKYQWTLRAIQ